MILYPAIDLRDGKVVRLLKGSFENETVYSDDAVSVARSFESAGALWIHVVDLDAAKTGDAHNRDVIASIVENVSIPVQAGGGVRDFESAKALLGTGVSRIVMGTAAHENPELVDALAREFQGRIAVGIDARNGEVATRGWLKNSGVSLADLVQRFEDVGIDAFVVTEIERDGTLAGPDIAGFSKVLRQTHVDVVASGGVGSLEDLSALASLEVDGKQLAGVIAGKAIYENKFSVEEAVGLLSSQSFGVR